MASDKGRPIKTAGIHNVQENVDEDDFADGMREFIREPLKTKDLKAIARKAGYDMDRIRDAYDAASMSSNDIQNLAAFMMKAVEKGWSAPVRKKAVQKTGANFTERKYTDEELTRIFKASLG